MSKFSSSVDLVRWVSTRWEIGKSSDTEREGSAAGVCCGRAGLSGCPAVGDPGRKGLGQIKKETVCLRAAQ